MKKAHCSYNVTRFMIPNAIVMDILWDIDLVKLSLLCYNLFL